MATGAQVKSELDGVHVVSVASTATGFSLPTSLVIPFFFAYMGHRLIGRNERSDVAVPNPPVEDFTSKELLDCDRLEAAPLLCTCVVDAQCEARLIKAARSESISCSDPSCPPRRPVSASLLELAPSANSFTAELWHFKGSAFQAALDSQDGTALDVRLIRAEQCAVSLRTVGFIPCPLQLDPCPLLLLDGKQKSNAPGTFFGSA